MSDKEEVLGKLESFERDNSSILSQLNTNYKLYRVQPTRKRAENLSNTADPEIFTEVEALATAVFEMIFSDPTQANFFDVENQGEEDIQKAILTKQVLVKQMDLIDLQNKFLAFLRTMIRDGTAVAEVPWVLGFRTFVEGSERVRRAAIDTFDFVPSHMTKFYYDDTAVSVDSASWCLKIFDVSFEEAKRLTKKDPRSGGWDAKAVDQAIGQDKEGSTTTYEEQRRTIAGRHTTKKRKLTVVEYWGTLESKKDGEDYRLFVSRNGHVLNPARLNPYNDGRKPFLEAKWIDTGEDFMGIGVAEVNSRASQMLNDRENFISDSIFQSLYNMWIRGPNSGIPGTLLKWSPYKIIDADTSGGDLTPLRPDLSGVPMARDLQNAAREIMKRASGATATLQGIESRPGTTLGEVNAIQNEAIRRVKANVRSGVSSLLRKFLYMAHARDIQFLDRRFIVRLTNANGEPFFQGARGRDLVLNPDFRLKLTTDSDSRPIEQKRLMEFLTALGGVLEQIAKMKQVTQGELPFNFAPIIEKLARTFDIDPKKLFQETAVQAEAANPLVQQQALQQLAGQGQEALLRQAALAQAQGVPANGAPIV